jgi:hypothetical protein
MPSEEFVMICQTWSLYATLWIASTYGPQSALTPFSTAWAMTSHELIAGAATPQLLILAATIPHQVVLQGHHYYVHRGVSPREEVMQCITSLERQILLILSKISLRGGRFEYADVNEEYSGPLPTPASTPFGSSQIVDLTPIGSPSPVLVANISNPLDIRGVIAKLAYLMKLWRPFIGHGLPPSNQVYQNGWTTT